MTFKELYEECQKTEWRNRCKVALAKVSEGFWQTSPIEGSLDVRVDHFARQVARGQISDELLNAISMVIAVGFLGKPNLSASTVSDEELEARLNFVYSAFIGARWG